MRRSASFVLISLIVTAFTATARAETVIWNGVIGDKVCNAPTCGTYGLQDIHMQVSYLTRITNADTGEVLTSGSTVPAGTHVAFTFVPHDYTHVYWFTAGYNADSPYGDWVAGAAAPSGDICVPKNDAGFGGKTDAHQGKTYAVLSVNPPAKSLSGLPADCVTEPDGYSKTCTLSTPGVFDASFNFGDTQGRFYGSDGLLKGAQARGIAQDSTSCTSPAPLVVLPQKTTASVNIPSRSVPFSLTVVPADGKAPAAPTLSGAGACVVETPFTISMTSTDPDGGDIRYSVDWNNDGTADQLIPASGYVASSASQTASRTYAVAGSKAVRVRAQNEKGLVSPWSSTLAFSCSGDSDTVALNEGENTGDLDYGDGSGADSGSADLSLRVLPSLVKSGATTKVNWSATGVRNCTVSAPNGDEWTGLASDVGGNVSKPITGETKYLLSCQDRTGATLTKSATVNIIPTWQEQ
jgi:hypothetical protein